MSNQLIAHLMSFQSRMKNDARTSVMFEGDYDTISEAIAFIRSHSPQKQPPCDNAHVKAGCEMFS